MKKINKQQTKRSMDKTILAFYINTVNVQDEYKSEYMDGCRNQIYESLKDQDCIPYIIETDNETRVECVYPKLITSEESIKNNEKIMSDLSENFKEMINNKNE